MDKGAHFYRCDFQVHTPRDRNWKGNKPTECEERMEVAKNMIAACRSKGLDAIAMYPPDELHLFPWMITA